MDARGWIRICSSFKSTFNDLCHSLALVAQRLCTQFMDTVGLVPLLSCRLIALDKNSGVRPVGIGEVACRIINPRRACAARVTVVVLCVCVCVFVCRRGSRGGGFGG